MYNYLEALNIVMDFLSSRCIITVKVIFWLNLIKNWYSIYKEYVCCHKYLFIKLEEFFGGFNNTPWHVYWFIPSGIHF